MAQAVQELLPAAEYVPAGQLVQAAAPVPEYVPAGQLVQVFWQRAGPYVPPGQSAAGHARAFRGGPPGDGQIIAAVGTTARCAARVASGHVLVQVYDGWFRALVLHVNDWPPPLAQPQSLSLQPPPRDSVRPNGRWAARVIDRGSAKEQRNGASRSTLQSRRARRRTDRWQERQQKEAQGRRRHLLAAEPRHLCGLTGAFRGPP